MKKFLSLVLALVMAMSLVTVSAGAKDFTDSADVNYAAAIDVMSELKVIDGYTDGSFRPAVELNRGAAAKIICNMILGPTTAAALSASSAPFVDVPADSVFAGYITYCSKEGIINGYADGTFRPTAPLTGYAFAKMLLGALGYDADLEGYTGANWGVNVAKQAIGIGLDDGIDGFSGTAYVTREAACQMALNTLKATMVDYDSKTSVTVNGAEVVVGGSNAWDVPNDATTETFKSDDKMQFAEKYFTNLKVEDAEDDFGRPADEWKIKNKSVGVFAHTPDATYTEKVAGKTIYADLGTSVEDANFDIYMDGGAASDKIAEWTAGFSIAKKNAKKIGAQGRLTEVYYDDDAETAKIIMINTYMMEVAEDYDEKDEELKLMQVDTTDNSIADELVSAPVTPIANFTLSSDDWAGLDAYAEGDLVLVTVADGEIKSLAAAEGFNAVIDEHVYEESVTADGTEYKFAWAWADCADDANYGVDDEYTLYTDAYGNIIYSKAVSAEKVYAFVTEYAPTSFMQKNSKVDAYMYFLDGSEDEVRVAKVAGKKVNATHLGDDLSDVVVPGTTYKLDQKENNWVTFTEKDGSYELKVVDQVSTVSASDNFDATASVIVDPENTVMIQYGETATNVARGTKTTQFVIVDGDGDVHTYTGIKNAPKVTAKADTKVYIVLDSDNNYADYVFINLGAGEMDGVANSKDVIFITEYEKEGTDSADNDYYRYKGLLNGEEGKIRTETDIAPVDAGLYVEVEYDSDSGYVSDWMSVETYYASLADYDYLSVTAGQKLSQKSGVITVYETEDETTVADKLYMTDDAVIYLIDGTDDISVVSAKQLVKALDGIAAELFVAMNDDGDVTALYALI